MAMVKKNYLHNIQHMQGGTIKSKPHLCYSFDISNTKHEKNICQQEYVLELFHS